VLNATAPSLLRSFAASLAYSPPLTRARSWEDSPDSAKIYIDELPGFDTWAEADVPKEGVSTYWDDRESLILLLASQDGSNHWYLHIPRLYRVVNDVNTVWKKKRLMVKLSKRRDEEWPTLDRKKVLDKTDEDREREFYDERREGKKTAGPKMMDKGKMPFGDDMANYVDQMGDLDIDSQAPGGMSGGAGGMFGGLGGMFGF
jgi:hypothetical protein